jgi:hypothetical protein
MDYSELPQPIEPVYLTNYPSQKIHLYEGEIKCSYKVNGNLYEFLGSGTIEYTWFPNPRATFKISHDLFLNPGDLDDSNITLQDLDRLIPIHIQNRRDSYDNPGKTYISGALSGKSVVGKEDELYSIVFHIVNFCHYLGEVTCRQSEFGISTSKGRISLFEEDWEITIDEVSSEDKKSSELFENLTESGGCAITHVGRIKKKDNSTFDSKEAVEIIDILSHFLSFAKGQKVPVVLFTGYDISGEKVYEQWDGAFSQPWKSRDSWLPKQDLRELPTIFPKFISWWKDWGQSAQIVINMYLEANNNTFTDVSIILAHSILESMARVVLVEKRSIILESIYDKRGNLTPADKISHLLNELSIPASFPPSHSGSIDDLVQFVNNNIPESDRKNKSASEASIVFTKIRNDITHAKKNYTLSSLVFFDTMSLGLWYVEMAILAMLEYDGVYSNRLRKPKWAGVYDLVPWSRPKESDTSIVE